MSGAALGLWLSQRSGASSGLVLLSLVCAAVLLAAGLAGPRGLWRRGQGVARAARVTAWCAAVSGLLLLVLQPLHRTTAAAGRAVLVTDSAAAGELDAASPMYWLASAGGSPPPGAVVVADARTLWRQHAGIGRLEVRGHGLDGWDWDGYRGAVDVHPPAVPPGISDAVWSRRLRLGETLRVSGVATGLAGLRGTLRLEGPAGPESEAVLEGGNTLPFTLTALPRAAGRAIYGLRALDATGHELFAESLDVTVESPRLPAVLILEGAPRFETRYLKDWLSAAGGVVAVRSTISRDRVRMEGAPGARGGEGQASGASGLRALSTTALARFDVLIADPAALEGLSAAERAALASAVGEGLGVIVAVPRGAALPAAFGPPALRAVPGLDMLSVRAGWAGEAALPPLDVVARELVPGEGFAPLVADPSGRIFAARARRGRGAVAWTLLHDAYRFVLEGNAVAHRRLWSHLISAVARPLANAGDTWQAPAGPIVVDRPVDLALLSGDAAPAARLDDGEGPEQALPLRQDALEPERWHARLWPRRAGWQQVRSAAGASLEVFAAPRTAWATWRVVERQRATERRARLAVGQARAATVATEAVPLPRWPWFALFLAGIGWLWIDERLRG